MTTAHLPNVAWEQRHNVGLTLHLTHAYDVVHDGRRRAVTALCGHRMTQDVRLVRDDAVTADDLEDLPRSRRLCASCGRIQAGRVARVRRTRSVQHRPPQDVLADVLAILADVQPVRHPGRPAGYAWALHHPHRAGFLDVPTIIDHPQLNRPVTYGRRWFPSKGAAQGALSRYRADLRTALEAAKKSSPAS